MIQFLVILKPALSLESSKQKIVQLLGKYQGLKSLEVDFVQNKFFHQMDYKMKSIGTLEVDKDGLVIWTIRIPSFLQVKMNSKGIEVYTKNKKGVLEKQTISTQKKEMERLFGMIKSLISLDYDRLQSSFNFSLNGKNKLILIPKKDLGPEFMSRSEMIFRPNGEVEKIIITEMSKDWIELNFKAPKIEK